MSSRFDGLSDIFTDPDVGFGEPVVYTPQYGDPVTINAIWTDRPLTIGLGQGPGASLRELRVDARAADVAGLAEGDQFERVSTGALARAVPPFDPDGEGMIAITLEAVKPQSAMILSWPPKDPDEVLDYKVDWAARLGDDTISTSTWTLPAGITSTTDSNTDSETIIWLTGGTLGETYELLNHIVTAGGRTMEQTVRLKIVSK